MCSVTAVRVAPRTANQGAYLKALKLNELVFGVGPAGTGKTYLAVAMAVDALTGAPVGPNEAREPVAQHRERVVDR
jgi:phosphate starvation-inducible PhoH-like protein